jgi:hypothetical protein
MFITNIEPLINNMQVSRLYIILRQASNRERSNPSLPQPKEAIGMCEEEPKNGGLFKVSERKTPNSFHYDQTNLPKS